MDRTYAEYHRNNGWNVNAKKELRSDRSQNEWIPDVLIKTIFKSDR